MQRTNSWDYKKYNGQQLLRFFHPGPDAASSINLFFRWPAPFVLVLCCLDRIINRRPRRGRQLVPWSRSPCSFQPPYSARRRGPLGFALLPIPDRSPSLRTAPVGLRTSPYRLPIWWRISRLVQSLGTVSLRRSRRFGVRVLPSSKQAPEPLQPQRFVRSCRSQPSRGSGMSK